MEMLESILEAINGVLWHRYVLYTLLGVGVLFTIWSGFSQYRSLTHGVAVIRGRYSHKTDPGAINHFQALSTALSGTVGLGNIAGVAVAVALGGPGAIFWMWIVGLVGMAIKTAEVTLAMLYRDTSDPENPHGGAMWVAIKGFTKMNPNLRGLGWVIGAIFCITVIISTFTGGNMFQAWNVAEITTTYAPSVPKPAVGIIIAVLVGLTIIGGIKRIGAVTGRLVPIMCVLYLLAAIYVLIVKIDQIPAAFGLIFKSALPPSLGGINAEPTGAFLGGTFGYAFLWGMKRALFSNEAGQGSSPIAHSAARTNEPVREGVVAGLEPFIDTLVVCTLTALVMLVSGAWNRDAAATYPELPGIVQALDANNQSVSNKWVIDRSDVPVKTAEAARNSNPWRENDGVFVLVKGDHDNQTGRELHVLTGTIYKDPTGALLVRWDPLDSKSRPEVADPGLYMSLAGASLTGHAFDRVTPGMGMVIVTLAAWLFAISTIISWAYYGEQAVTFLFGAGGVLPYKLIYCAAIIVSTLGFIKTDAQLDAWTALGTGVMLFANIPIMLIFSAETMKAYRRYIRRLKAGEFPTHRPPELTEVIEGKDEA